MRSIWSKVVDMDIRVEDMDASKFQSLDPFFMLWIKIVHMHPIENGKRHFPQSLCVIFPSATLSKPRSAE